MKLEELIENDDYDESNPDTYDEEEKKAFDVATLLYDRYEDYWKTDPDFDTIKNGAFNIIENLPNATIEEIAQTLLQLNPELRVSTKKKKMH